MKINKIAFFVFVFMLLCGCSVKKNEETEKKEENNIETAYEQFIDQFSKDYPDFELIDIQKGTSDNAPVLLVAVGENKDDGTSSTLFIVDDDGIGEVRLAGDKQGIYRKEDGLVLDKNVISVSLTVIDSHQNEEIHDFKVTVTKSNKQGTPHTTYSNEETIRNE